MSDYLLILEDPGLRKIQVIKTVREISCMGLKEAKDLVDQAPNRPAIIPVMPAILDPGHSLKESALVFHARDKLQAAGADARVEIAMSDEELLDAVARAAEQTKDWLKDHPDATIVVFEGHAHTYNTGQTRRLSLLFPRNQYHEDVWRSAEAWLYQAIHDNHEVKTDEWSVGKPVRIKLTLEIIPEDEA